jgi:ankyrin repeat protein
VKVVSVLLSAGAALEARDEVSAVGDDEMSDESESDSLEDEKTPLHIACQGGHVEMVSELLSAGAALEARAEVSAVGDDELSDESLTLSRAITGHLCTLLVKKAMWRWSLSCCQLGLPLKLELR